MLGSRGNRRDGGRVDVDFAGLVHQRESGRVDRSGGERLADEPEERISERHRRVLVVGAVGQDVGRLRLRKDGFRVFFRAQDSGFGLSASQFVVSPAIGKEHGVAEHECHANQSEANDQHNDQDGPPLPGTPCSRPRRLKNSRQLHEAGDGLGVAMKDWVVHGTSTSMGGGD